SACCRASCPSVARSFRRVSLRWPPSGSASWPRPSSAPVIWACCPISLSKEGRLMEVILLERVEKLGAIGDVVKVKDGFARNYLLPNKKALRANESNRKVFEANRAKIEADNADKRAEAEIASKTVDGKSVQLIRQAS